MYTGEHAEPKRSGIGRTILSIAGTIVLIVALSWGLRTFVFQAYEIGRASCRERVSLGV